MPLVRHEPHPALRGHVRAFHGFTEQTGTVTRRREGPGSSVVFVISLGNEWRIGESFATAEPLARLTSFVAGLHRTAVITEHDGWSEGMQVDLTPTAAFSLLGVPLGELAGISVPLDALLGRGAERLVDRLAELDGWPARFELLEAALAKRIDKGPRPAPGVVWAWCRLAETHGRARIGALADELGWSRRRLVARFCEQVGLPPKAVAQLLRFERAAELLAQERPPSWAELAFDCGYFDQSHLINDFRAIVGVTPTEYAAPTLAA